MYFKRIYEAAEVIIKHDIKVKRTLKKNHTTPAW